MGTQITFTEENVKKNPFDYPKLKLAKGETALLTYVEAPFREWVHNVQKPVLDEAGNVLYSIKERADGTEYSVPKLAFVSNPICLGDPAVLDSEGPDGGLDPANCPICARAAAGEKGMAPKRRFAMHVIRTNTRPGDFEPTEPAGHSLLIWAFTETIFNKLYAFEKKFGLQKTALELGPCQDATFQKAELQVHNSVVIDADTIKAVFSEKNRSEDPTVFCGNRKSRARIEDDLAIVDAEWAKSRGETTGTAVASTRSLNEGIGALLDEGNPEGVPTVAADSAPVTSFDDLPSGGAKAQTEWAAEPAPKATADVDLDDILAGL